MIKIAINAISVKKISGGVFQIAPNFILATLKYKIPEVEWLYIVSEDVDKVIHEEFTELVDKKYFVYPSQPDFRGTYIKVKKELNEWENRFKPDLIYSISAPSYFSFKAPEVMRFTNPWVATPNKYAYKTLSFFQKLRMVLYCMNQKRLLRRANYFVTQTQAVKKGLLKFLSIPEESINVVSNVLPIVISSMENTHIISDNKDFIEIACVAAPVPHKNLDIIPEVLYLLRNQYNINNVRFHVTVPEDSPMWVKILKLAYKYDVVDGIVNHGRLPQAELSNLYRRSHMCFLPTLLEVFSVSPLEAMYYKLPIVATDFAFNREVLNDAALYYEPMNAASAANQFVKYIDNPSLRLEMYDKMREQLKKFDDYEAHFKKTVAFLMSVV